MITIIAKTTNERNFARLKVPSKVTIEPLFRDTYTGYNILDTYPEYLYSVLTIGSTNLNPYGYMYHKRAVEINYVK